MKKIYLLSIIFFTTILLILFVIYNRYSTYYEDEQINSYISKNIDILNENLSFEKRYALSLSLYISKNENIKKALQTNNQPLALREMDNFLEEIKNSAGIDNIDIQIHTKDILAFARNWDKSNYIGAKLDFRKGLVHVKKTKKSFVSIELGKRLNIKAISPILDKNGDFIGSVEIIMNFKNIKKRLKKFDLDMLVLLDKKFINIAVDLKNHKKIYGYYIVENSYSKKLYDKLKKHYNRIFKEKKFYHSVNGKIIVLVPMLSVGIDDIGVIALCMDSKNSGISHITYQNLDFKNSTYKFNKSQREVIIK
jgi:hypothetical protein